MTPDQKREFERQVQEFASSDAVEILLARLEEAYTLRWKATIPNETIARDDAYYMVRAIEALRTEIRSVAMDPAVSAFNRERKTKAI